MTNQADTTLWAIPAPTDATRVYPVVDGIREFLGTARKVRGIGVDIDGHQTADGQAFRCISVYCASNAGTLTAIEARELAAALSAAADEVEHLHTSDRADAQ